MAHAWNMARIRVKEIGFVIQSRRKKEILVIVFKVIFILLQNVVRFYHLDKHCLLRQLSVGFIFNFIHVDGILWVFDEILYGISEVFLYLQCHQERRQSIKETPKPYQTSLMALVIYSMLFDIYFKVTITFLLSVH